MSLIQCPECSREVSEHAASCPQCAFPLASRAARVQTEVAPQSRRMGTFGKIVVICVGILTAVVAVVGIATAVTLNRLTADPFDGAPTIALPPPIAVPPPPASVPVVAALPIPDTELQWQALERPWTRLHFSAGCDDEQELSARPQMPWVTGNGTELTVRVEEANVYVPPGEGEEGAGFSDRTIRLLARVDPSGDWVELATQQMSDGTCADSQGSVVYAGRRPDGLLLASLERLPQHREGGSPGESKRFLFRLEGDRVVTAATWEGLTQEVPQLFRIRPSGDVAPAAQPGTVLVPLVRVAAPAAPACVPSRASFCRSHFDPAFVRSRCEQEDELSPPNCESRYRRTAVICCMARETGDLTIEDLLGAGLPRVEALQIAQRVIDVDCSGYRGARCE